MSDKTQQQPASPSKGWIVVPVEPTPEWIDSAIERGIRLGNISNVIADVIAAAPQPKLEAVYQWSDMELGGGFKQWNDSKRAMMEAAQKNGYLTRVLYTVPPAFLTSDVVARTCAEILQREYERVKEGESIGVIQACLKEAAEEIRSLLDKQSQEMGY